jgi:TolB-like protein
LTRRSLAILPLQNRGEDSTSDFLGLSLADVLITKLAYVSSLNVRPSAAIEKYRGTAIDLQKVAADLKVDTLHSVVVRSSVRLVLINTFSVSCAI